MKSIILMSEVLPPQTGGSGRWLWNLYTRMDNLHVIFVSGTTPSATDFDNLHTQHIFRDCMNFPSWGLSDFKGLRSYIVANRKIYGIIRTVGAERSITESHCARCIPEGLIGLSLRVTHKIPYYCFVHGEELNIYWRSKELRLLARLVLKHASGFIVNSNNTKKILQNQWHIAESRIKVLHPGVDISVFRPTVINPSKREKLGWASKKIILTVGRLQERKGHEMLIRALPVISKLIPRVLYCIIGDGEQRNALRKLTKELGVSDFVQFRGEVSDTEIIECYQQCDLFVLPNREVNGDFEGFGMVLIEAQACGKAVIAGSSGGTQETIKIPETGVLADCTSPEELAATIARLLGDDALRDTMGQAARHWVCTHFSWEALTEKASKYWSEFDERDKCP